ncbi:hypothetical protein V3N99_08960 [Dermatophilaceae bacterium Soc4.6]
MLTDDHPRPDGPNPSAAGIDTGPVRGARLCASAASRGGPRGLIATAVGAVPVVGPWLLNSLLVASCCGVGASAAATAATASAGAAGSHAVGFGAWWLLPALLALVLAGQTLRGRRRHLTWARIGSAAATTVLLSGAAYFATVLIVAGNP